jgi:hypothetical protein
VGWSVDLYETGTNGELNKEKRRNNLKDYTVRTLSFLSRAYVVNGSGWLCGSG